MAWIRWLGKGVHTKGLVDPRHSHFRGSKFLLLQAFGSVCDWFILASPSLSGRGVEEALRGVGIWGKPEPSTRPRGQCQWMCNGNWIGWVLSVPPD